MSFHFPSKRNAGAATELFAKAQTKPFAAWASRSLMQQIPHRAVNFAMPTRGHPLNDQSREVTAPPLSVRRCNASVRRRWIRWPRDRRFTVFAVEFWRAVVPEPLAILAPIADRDSVPQCYHSEFGAQRHQGGGAFSSARPGQMCARLPAKRKNRLLVAKNRVSGSGPYSHR